MAKQFHQGLFVDHGILPMAFWARADLCLMQGLANERSITIYTRDA